TVTDGREATEIEVVVPPELSALIPVASMVHYLGAEVSVESGTSPRLELGEETHSLGNVETLPRRAADVLRRTFYLDCVARGAGDHGGTLSVSHTFDTLALDAERLYEAPMAERVRTYLDSDFEAVREEFPEWHLTMHVEPTYEHAATVPYFINKVPFLFRPEGERISEQEWLELSLTGGGFGDPTQSQRGAETRSSYGRREVSNIDLLNPEPCPGRTHGWLADGVPIDGFKTVPEAYRHRDEALDDPGEKLSVTAIVNETDVSRIGCGSDGGLGMQDEHEAAVEHYQTRAEELRIDIDVRENVSTAELARVFESHNDFVHFIGHHEASGLSCTDGFLSPDSLDTVRTRAFFLNACGSYPFGEELVRRGGVAGGVTFASVGDSDAAEVGTTFARLLVNGFCISRGLAKAARHAISPRDYAVIGDGTFQASQSDDLVPLDGYVVPTESGDFKVLLRNNQPRKTGNVTVDMFNTNDSQRLLVGSTEMKEISKEQLVEYLSATQDPIVFRGELFWPEELKSRIE
ncbi:MAG: hypothetical protein ABEI99_07375, partial [Halobaculum sp.]